MNGSRGLTRLHFRTMVRARASPEPWPFRLYPRFGLVYDGALAAIFIVAHNGLTTLAKVLDRIPTSIRKIFEDVYEFDNASHDQTQLLIRGYQKLHRGRPQGLPKRSDPRFNVPGHVCCYQHN